MNKIAFIALLALFLFPSAFAACAGLPGDDSQLIMRISSPTNAHAELWNGAGGYTTEICYDDIFGKEYTGASPHASTATNDVLTLSGQTNAHVATAGYPTTVYYGDLKCSYRASCNADEECIATISDTTNAHIATCTDAPYATKVCCSSAEVLNTAPVADAGAPHVIILPNAVDLDGSGSMDDEDCGVGFTNCSMLTYDWVIANDPAVDPGCTVTATGMKPSITCSDEGIADVTLTVTDLGGLQDTDTTTISVSVPGTGVCGVGFSPSEIEIESGIVGVTVAYAGFDTMPPDYLSINCGSAGVSAADFSCSGGANGICTFTCGPYDALGQMGPIVVSLPNGVANVVCSVPGARVFVFGTKVFASPIPLPRGSEFSMARADVAVSSLTAYNIYVEAEIPTVGIPITTGAQPILAGTVGSFDLIAAGGLGEEILDIDDYVISAETFELVAGSKGTVTKPFNVVASTGQGVLNITQLFAEPLALDSATPSFTSLDIAVLNSGDNTVNAEIKLSVVDAVTGLPIVPEVSVSGVHKSIALEGTEVWDSAIHADLIHNLDVSLLPSGSYQLIVEAYEVGKFDPSDTESVFFTVGQPAAVPELDLVFIPLLAFSALAILFFSERRKS